MGGPSPPPGRLDAVLLEPDAASEPGAPLPSWRVSSNPSPETLNARFWPNPVFEATCTFESGWLGSFIGWKPAAGAAPPLADIAAMAPPGLSVGNLDMPSPVLDIEILRARNRARLANRADQM